MLMSHEGIQHYHPFTQITSRNLLHTAYSLTDIKSPVFLGSSYIYFLFCCLVGCVCCFVCLFFLIQSWDLQGYPSLQKAAYINFSLVPVLYLPVPILSPLFMRTTQNSFFTAQ